MDFTKRWVTHLRSNHRRQVSVSFCTLCKSELPNMDKDFFRSHVLGDPDTHASLSSDEDIDNAFRSIMSTEPRMQTQHTDRPHRLRELGKLDGPKTGTDHHRSNSDPEDDQSRSVPPACRLLPTQTTRSPPRPPPRPPPHVNEAEPVMQMMLQPEPRPISQDQLVAEVKGIYAGLVIVETKCIEVDNAQSSNSDANKLNNEQWQALVALHRTLLHEHHDFFLASQHPSASVPLRRLASKYAMPARMWRHGIHSFLELLRHQLPESIEHMLTFPYLSYSMMAQLYETVPAFEDTWIECLGDLGRYRMAIEDGDIKDREIWTGVSQHWYNKGSNKSPTTGRLYHHLAILARPNALQELHYYAKSLCVPIPFLSARERVMTLFDPTLDAGSFSLRLSPVDNAFLRVHGILFSGLEHSVYEFMGITVCCNLLGYGKEVAKLLRAISPKPAMDDIYIYAPDGEPFRKAQGFAVKTWEIGNPPLRPLHANHSFGRNFGQPPNHGHTNTLTRQSSSTIFIWLISFLIWISTLAGPASTWLGGGEMKREPNFRRYLKRWHIDGHGLGIPLRTKTM